MKRILLVAIAVVGVIGQSLILRHDLVDSYPFKMMSNPNSDFYVDIARNATVLAPAIAVALVIAFSARLRHWTPGFACVACPVAYFRIFALAHVGANVDLQSTANFDRTMPIAVIGDFAQRCAGLLIGGAGIGALTGAVINWLLDRFGSPAPVVWPSPPN